MPQPARARPLGEPDLADQFGSDPGDVAFADRARVGERRGVGSAGPHRAAELVQGVGVEAGADLARVAQRRTVVVAEQQRPELDPGSARGGEPADHELLSGLALELLPVLGPRAAIRAVGTLGDHTLPALAAGVSEHRL